VKINIPKPITLPVMRECFWERLQAEFEGAPITEQTLARIQQTISEELFHSSFGVYPFEVKTHPGESRGEVDIDVNIQIPRQVLRNVTSMREVIEEEGDDR
jgi:hypothetical protein